MADYETMETHGANEQSSTYLATSITLVIFKYFLILSRADHPKYSFSSDNCHKESIYLSFAPKNHVRIYLSMLNKYRSFLVTFCSKR